MSLDELAQAIAAARWGDAEADVTEVIARMLEVPQATVVRVLFAHQVAREHAPELWPDTSTLSGELRVAIREAVQRGLARVRVRDLIEAGDQMHVPVAELISSADDVCRGCPWSIPCTSYNHSTPEKCFLTGPPLRIHPRSATDPHDVEVVRLSGRAAVYVKPVKLVGDRATVTCDHPRGTYTVDAEKLW